MSEDHFDEKQVAVLPSGIKEQTRFDEKLSPEWMRNERLLIDLREENLELQFTSVSAYLQMCMIPRDYRLSVFLLQQM